jgi:hypothetical protein
MSTLSGGSIVGINHEPFMRLEYGCVIRRMGKTYSPIGSPTSIYNDLPGVKPCDISPLSDELAMAQVGQTDTLTHIIHFQAGTDVLIRDEIRIVYAPQPGNWGNVGDTYILMEVLEPSTNLQYIRCRAMRGKVPTA